MAILEIPVRADDFHYQFRVDLDGVTYILVMRFNKRADRWIMDIMTGGEEMIVAGVPLLLGTSLLARYADDRLPQGDLFVANMESDYEECGRDQLGANVLLLYREAD